MSNLWKAVLGVILIFIFGFLSGIVCSSIVVHRKMAAFMQHPAVVLMAAMERNLTKNLDLDEAQKTEIHDYFTDNLRQHKLLQAQIQPQVQVLNQNTVKQITATLRPDQQERFNKNLDELRNRFWKYASEPAAQPNAIGNGANPGPGTPPPGK